MSQPPLSPVAQQALVAYAESLYELLCKRAQSWGLIDIAVDVNGQCIDGELMFSKGPDMGFVFDVSTSVCKYCQLVGDNAETWLPVKRTGLDVVGVKNDAEMRERVLELMDGVLEARRPLLKV